MLVVLSAGFAYSWTGLSSKLLSDQLLAHAWLVALGWVAVTAAAGIVGLLSEMSSLQRRPATQVAPIVFVVQMVVPVLLAPLLGSESWESTPLGGGAIAIFLLVVAAGTAALASSPAVAGLVGATPDQHADRARLRACRRAGSAGVSRSAGPSSRGSGQAQHHDLAPRQPDAVAA